MALLLPESEARLLRGDLLPNISSPPPGAQSRRIFEELEAWEAPGINTLIEGQGSLVWQEALGSNVLDADGNLYIDLTSGFGVAAIGHRHPRVVAAVREQSGRLLHGLGDVHGHPWRARLARELCRIVPVDNPQVYFAISGSDAVEITLKTALLATGRPGILAFDPAYHGVTLGSLSATSRPAFRTPFQQHLHGHLHRLPFAAPPEEIERLLSAEPSIGSLILEPIAGREGVLLPPDGWLSRVAGICRRRGVVLIADEIFTGFGRTGHRFAVEREGVRPDLLCCGKALGGGLPVAAAIGRTELLSVWSTGEEALHTATFVANPLASAAALTTLEVLESEELTSRAAELGQWLGEALHRALHHLPQVREIRGRGLLWGIELADATLAKAWSAASLRHGLVVLAGGSRGTVLQVVPPLSITCTQLEAAVELLQQALAEALQDPARKASGEPPS
ncbi:MAG: aspartate aminotransferase family protein [Acidobacteria bacterium]|nr:aspartate aminotransferase family protein [Acidobacteriota bacterium]